MEKNKKIILNIVKSFFGYKDLKIEPQKWNLKKLDKLIKETSMDGIACKTLEKRNNIPDSFLKNLKHRFEIVKQVDKNIQKAFKNLENLPFVKILIKENVYKFNEKYQPGTRYGCDIDIWTSSDQLFEKDSLMQKNNFYLEGIDITHSPDIINLAYKINKDIAHYPELIEETKTLIEECKAFQENYTPEKPILELKRKIEKNISSLKNVSLLYEQIAKSSSYLSQEWLETSKRFQKLVKKGIETSGKTNDLLLQKNIILEQKNLLKILELKRKKELITAINNIETDLFTITMKNILFTPLENEELQIYSDMIIKKLNASINRVKKLRETPYFEKNLNYHHASGILIDVHLQLFTDNLPFKVFMENLETEPKNKYTYILRYEDSIIVDACHFCFNLSKYKNFYAFQGFLKYLTDLLYKISFKKIDWDKIVKKAKQTNSSPQVWFYLSLAKKYLDAPVPEKTIKQLKKDSGFLQNAIFRLISGKKLLFNQANFFVKLYAIMYLKKGRMRLFTIYSHRIYNKFTSWKKVLFNIITTL